MENEVFVPLPHIVQKGDLISRDQLEDNQALFTQLKEFCEKSLEDEYELDRTIYARGIRVLTDSNSNVARLHEWLDR